MEWQTAIGNFCIWLNKFKLLSDIADGVLSFGEADAEAKAWKMEKVHSSIVIYTVDDVTFLYIEQVTVSLEDSFEMSRENLPAKLTRESSLLRLTEEVRHNSRKKRPDTSANFKKINCAKV